MPTDDQKRAAFMRAVEPQLQAWLNDISTRGLDRSVTMSALNEESRVSSGFGGRNVQGGHGEGTPPPTRNHEALDYTTVRSNDGRRVPVVAVVSGRVLFTGDPGHGSGMSIVIGGDDGRIYTYAHLADNSFRVRAGQRVERDTEVGIMGRTGTATGNCVHVVERNLDLGGDFDAWSWRNKTGLLDDHIAPSTVRQALQQYRASDSDGRITWQDFERVLPTNGYRPHLRRGDRIPANDQWDRYPHVYAYRTQLVEHYMGQPWHAEMGAKPALRGNELQRATERAVDDILGLNPGSTARDARLNALDDTIAAYSRRHPNETFRPHDEWMHPNVREHARRTQEAQGTWNSLVCTVTLGAADSYCPPPPRAPTNGRGRQ